MYRVSNRQYLMIELLKKYAELGYELISIDVVAGNLGIKPQDIMRDIAELELRGLVRTRRSSKYLVRITELGLKYLKDGLPEYNLYKLIKELRDKGVNELSISELLNMSKLGGDEFSAAIGILRSYGLVKVFKGSIKLADGEVNERELLNHVARVTDLLSTLNQPLITDFLSELLLTIRRRGFIEIEEIKELSIGLTDEGLRAVNEGLIIPKEVVTTLNPELITSGRWAEVEFKEFDLSVEVPLVYPVRRHPYVDFLSYVRDVITSMGFEEMKGPHVELELWNFDVLYVPQYHPARSTTDVYFISNQGLYLRDSKVGEELLRVVGLVHESGAPANSLGWGYRWDPRKALRLILRTHTTAVSMRTILERGCGEYRYFSLDRVFRPDTPDPTHLMEFHQLEGIIVGKYVTFKHLLGFFKEFAKRLGLGDVLFRPAYFPFTEPSVEGYVKHSKLGWIEVFPGGMFRPEVLRPLNLLGYNVAAWGIGIDRIAMMVLGIDDIRDLYTNSLDVIKEMKVPEVMIR